jgi:hypothetical protein
MLVQVTNGILVVHDDNNILREKEKYLFNIVF